MTLLPGDHHPGADDLSFEEIEHELKTPLTSMRSLSEIIRDYPDLPDDERQRFLAAILSENERLQRAIERLLDSTLRRRLLT